MHDPRTGRGTGRQLVPFVCAAQGVFFCKQITEGTLCFWTEFVVLCVFITKRNALIVVLA
jgi:hypothetical protein